jgi:hypothetical protein
MVIEDKTVLKRELTMIRSNHDKENNNGLCSILLAVVAITALILPGVVFAQEGHQVGEMTLKAGDRRPRTRFKQWTSMEKIRQAVQV